MGPPGRPGGSAKGLREVRGAKAVAAKDGSQSSFRPCLKDEPSLI